jgi:hypothetical protein
MRRRPGVTATALCIAALAAAGCGSDAGTSDGATATFFTALGEGNGKEACALISSARSQSLVLDPVAKGKGSCEERVKKIPKQRRETFATVIAEPVPGTGGKTVTARFEDKSGSPTVPYSVSMVKSGEDWQLLAVNAGGAP